MGREADSSPFALLRVRMTGAKQGDADSSLRCALGGRQAITGAQVYLFAAGASGYGTASTSLLTAPA